MTRRDTDMDRMRCVLLLNDSRGSESYAESRHGEVEDTLDDQTEGPDRVALFNSDWSSTLPLRIVIGLVSATVMRRR